MNAIILSAIWGIVMMFSGIFTKSKTAIRNTAILGLVLLLLANWADMTGNHIPIDVHKMLYFDTFGLLGNSIAFASTLLLVLLSGRDMEKVGHKLAEYFALIFFVLCGVAIVTTFNTLLMLFLGIEIISIPLYILTGADNRSLKSNEAALKCFLMGSFATGLMLLGIAFLYGASQNGTFFIDDLWTPGPSKVTPVFIAGLLLLLVSMAFKVSAAPFHFWTPDVYDGAPTVFTSFMATIVKAAVFIAFIRLFDEAFGELQSKWQLLIAIITVATLFIGNITAGFQQSVKRMLAYSSIAQAGFMMLSLYAMNTDAKEGLLLYVTAYSFATIGIFAVLIKMKDYTFDGFNGFARHQPLLAAIITIFLLSLAGIPLTSGFLSKFYMLKAAMDAGKNLLLVIFAVMMAAVSVYYYFRVIQAMYFKEGNTKTMEVTVVFKWSLVILAGLVILLGIFPNLLLYWYYF